MNGAPGQLILIAGLPGSGKSHWIGAHFSPSDFFVVDDFMAHALGDVSKFTYSRWYCSLVFALRSGRDSVVADIAFCDVDRRKEALRVMKDAVDKLDYRWIFFESAPEQCRLNIERDAREKRRAAQSRLDALDEWSRRYRIPRGVKTEAVYRATG